jgi:two-component system CheB/CheR fusion protein
VVLGWEVAEVIGRHADMIFTEEDQAAGVPEREAETAANTGLTSDERWHQRKDGSRFWGSGTMAPLQTGGETGFVKILRDRTDARSAEERQQLLLSELQHRVRNTLTIIRSISRLTARTSDTVEDYAESFEGRLTAFARVQTALTRDPALGVDLRRLITEELDAYGTGPSERVDISGPSVSFQPKAAESFALAIHELATNALKYGALSTADGRIGVQWRTEAGAEGRALVFEWTEKGVDLDAGTPKRRGFGTELLERSLSYDLKAKTSLAFTAHGLHCTIAMPVTDAILSLGD